MKPLILTLGLFAALPAEAGSFTPPEGCETFLTVQARGCRVSNHYRCEADAPGDQWRADFDQEGVFFLSHVNREAEWVESFEFNPDVRQSLDDGAADPAEFSKLLSSGRDDFAFSLSRTDGQNTEVTGFDALTGRSVTIDGVTLQETEFEYTETDAEGTILRQSRGNEYISADWRLFFAGPSEYRDGEAWRPMDGSPVKFILPGEPGFAATQPIYECGALMSSYRKSSEAKEALSHDDL